jgi:hypothetical protein
MMRRNWRRAAAGPRAVTIINTFAVFVYRGAWDM